MTRKSRTLKVTLLRALVAPFVSVAVAAAVLPALNDLPTVAETRRIETATPAHHGAVGHGPTAAQLVKVHDCWTGEGPVSVVPGHVVVTREDAAGPVYGGVWLTGQALEQVFDGVDHGLEVHAFCR